MHQRVVLTDSQGRIWRYTPSGLERIPQPFHFRCMNWLLTLAHRLG